MAANDGTKKHGKNGAIYFAPITGTDPDTWTVGTPVKVAVKNEWTLSLNRDYVDATVFGDTNKTYLVGLKDISGTFAGLLDTSGDLIVANSSTDAVYVYLYADDVSSPQVLVAHGAGLVDAAIQASNTDAVRVTGNFRAAAAWTIPATFAP
jgi:hypothetical protein